VDRGKHAPKRSPVIGRRLRMFDLTSIHWRVSPAKSRRRRAGGILIGLVRSSSAP
jgi:hypothetical protein